MLRIFSDSSFWQLRIFSYHDRLQNIWQSQALRLLYSGPICRLMFCERSIELWRYERQGTPKKARVTFGFQGPSLHPQHSLTPHKRQLSHDYLKTLIYTDFSSPIHSCDVLQSAKMSLDPPTYLNSLQNNIRARPIPWEGAVRAGTITDNDLKKIKAVDKVRKEQRKQTVEADTEAYTSLLLGGGQGKSVLESAAKRADVVQYMLVLSGDLINGA